MWGGRILIGLIFWYWEGESLGVGGEEHPGIAGQKRQIGFIFPESIVTIGSLITVEIPIYEPTCVFSKDFHTSPMGAL